MMINAVGECRYAAARRQAITHAHAHAQADLTVLGGLVQQLSLPQSARAAGAVQVASLMPASVP